MRSLVGSSDRPQGCMTVWTCGIDSALQLLELNIEGCTLQQNTRGRSIEHGTQHVDRIVHIRAQAQHLTKADIRCMHAFGQQVGECQRRECVHRHTDAPAHVFRITRLNVGIDHTRDGRMGCMLSQWPRCVSTKRVEPKGYMGLA